MRSPVSRFAYVHSDIGIKRSTFDRNNRHLTTMSAGSLYPLLVDEVLPGDTYQIDVSSLLRMSTPIHPVMDNCYLDLYAFFVPCRIVWDNFKAFMGESPEDPYINPIDYSVPQLIGPLNPSTTSRGVAAKSILDYMGVPAGTVPQSINALPVRGFCKIWNEWFRDQNLQNAMNCPTDDADSTYSTILNPQDPEAFIFNGYRGADLPPVNKYHDYFTSSLKEPQKGNPVPIPLSGFAPVYASELVDVSSIPGSFNEFTKMVTPDGQPYSGNLISDNGYFSATEGLQNGNDEILWFNNLGADLSNLTGLYSTINDLRYAFQLQKFLEADNRGGTRYREILKQHFGVTSPDSSQQVPEFLGGKRIPINMSQVLQTSATSEVSPQGNTAAYSLTIDTMSNIIKSFTEHGYIYVVGCIRTEHTYQNGIERMWSRKNKFDFYFPEFANISEQPIYNREIFNPIVSAENPITNYDQANEIFGYQEAWAEYRYKPNRVSGEFRSTYPQSLDIWHYADDYTEQPYLSDEWIRETRSNIDRTLAVSSDVSDQFICDFYFKMKTTRPMPVNSIPGLADHH